MRVFLALGMDPKIEGNIRDFQEKMKLETVRFKKDITWVFPDECHSSLAFIGDVSEESVTEICDLIDPITLKTNPFRLKVEGTRAYGPSPKVIWAVIKDGSDELELLNKQIVEALDSTEYETDKKRFTPHITLARISDHRAARFMKDISFTLGRYPFGAMAVRSIGLYQSEKGKYGAKYTLLAEFPLGQPEFY